MWLCLVIPDSSAIPPIWVEGHFNSTKNSNILHDIMFPALDRHYGVSNWLLRQDGAHFHRYDATQRLLKHHQRSSGFRPKEFWLLDDPDMNVFDWHGWMHVSTPMSTSQPARRFWPSTEPAWTRQSRLKRTIHSGATLRCATLLLVFFS